MHKIYWKWSPLLSNNNAKSSRNSSTHKVENKPSNVSLDSRTGSKREDVDAKWSERQLIAQRGTNPFLDANYADGISGFGGR